jgi:hypothetical protein
MMPRLLLAALATLLLTFGALAHGTGPNGGPMADAGGYHVEMVAKGTSLTIYLNTEDDKPVPAAGHKATAILVVAGKPQRIELAPAGDNKLTGQAAVALPASPKGAVQITMPSGKTAQVKFD